MYLLFIIFTCSIAQGQGKCKGQQSYFLNVGVTIWLVCLKEEAAKCFPVCFKCIHFPTVESLSTDKMASYFWGM